MKALMEHWKGIMIAIVFAVLTLTSVILFYENSLLTIVIMALISIVMLLKYRSAIITQIFVFTAIVGPLTEIIVIRSGAWNYTNPDFLGIPAWLFFVWGNAGVVIYQASYLFKKLGVKS